MDSVIFEDSPLAAYLEGEGAIEPNQTVSHNPIDSATSKSQSFAPSGPSILRATFRDRVARFIPLHSKRNNVLQNIRGAISTVLSSRLGKADNTRFLEQFRYTIIASQLLDEQVNSLHYGSVSTLEQGDVPKSSDYVAFTNTGAVLTAVCAFSFVWFLHWARGGHQSQINKSRLAILVVSLSLLVLFSYLYLRKQWLRYLRSQVLESASRMILVSQALNYSASTGISLIQEVELVSRGYRLSSPLPPISRLEERSQSRRCSRLRKTVSSSLMTCVTLYAEICVVLRPWAQEIDLDRYYDIYDIAADDLQDIETEITIGSDPEDILSLRSLKDLFQKVHMTRKILLCCLLALDANGSSDDFIRWSIGQDQLDRLISVTTNAEESIRLILNEEERLPTSPKPNVLVDPGKEKVRAQLRKLNTLSQGVRGLQAKMHVLREESDRALDDSDDVTQIGSSLMSQYESIGADLRMLMQEWESGKAALASNIDKNERRISSMTSPTLSLGGTTDVEGGSPSDALKALTGEMSSDDDVFEAVAAPRQRSGLTREERIARMKENRLTAASLKESKEANTHMLKELETVIRLRPRGRTTGRITSI